MGITKEELKSLPKSPMDNESKQQILDYVNMVMEGSSRTNALKTVYPERYERAIERAGGNKAVIAANVKKEFNQVERSKYAQQLFTSAEKHWWMKFLTKKQKLYDKLYKIALDDDETTKNQISAAKVLLTCLPSAPREDKLEITHKVQADEFKAMLLDKKKQLYSAANDVIDVEVDMDEDADE